MTNLNIEPLEPDIGEDDITGSYEITIGDSCGEDISTYAYVTNKGGGTILQSGTVSESGVIPPYTPIPSDNQADIHVEITPMTTCDLVGATKLSNTVTPANNP